MSVSHIANCISGITLASALLAGAPGCATFRPETPATNPVVPQASKSATGVEPASFESPSFDDEPPPPIGIKDFAPSNLSSTVKRLNGLGPDRRVAQQAFDEGEALYQQAAAAEGDERVRLFVEAAQKFEVAAERFPKSSLEQNALFYAGESRFFADEYTLANTTYERLIKAYPNNRYLDTVDRRRFAIAQYWLDINRQSPESFYYTNWFDKTRPWRDARGNALRLYDKIRIDDPTGKLSDDATMAAANEYMLSGKFNKADEMYADLRKAYPTSEHQFMAHFLGLKAKLSSYLGPNYSIASLDEAEKLIKQMRRQFPVESQEEQEFIDRAAAEIKYKKAEKVWNLGEYYYNRGEYRAAKTHYDRLLKDFNDTPFALRADERIASSQGQPPVPPQKLPWLVDLLPKRDKAEQLIAASKRARQNEVPSVENLDTTQIASPSPEPGNYQR